MGAGNSKPEDASKHVFSSDIPVRFSAELVDSLQSTPETNNTRAKTLELHISQRVAEELDRIQKREQETLDSLRKELFLDTSHDEQPSPTSQKATAVKSAIADALPGPLTPGHEDRKDERLRQAQSTPRVQQEIAKLKKQLSERKVLKDLPPDVQKAREAVVTCLRVNDRRPLDCWAEVEGFKAAVGRMEREFVERIL